MKNIDNHEKMKEYVKLEQRKLEERKYQIKQLMSNYKYITWVENFTKIYPKIREDDFLYPKLKLDSKDIELGKKLNLLYEGINTYASKNYIYPSKDSDFVEYYKIKYNNIGYEVGIILGQRPLCFLEKVDEFDNTFIEFSDIVLNKKQVSTDYIEKELNELKNILEKFYKIGIPFPALKETIDNVIWSMELKESNKPRMVLSKTRN